MINLLPQLEKKKLQKEFRLRYGVVILLLLLVLEIVTFISFIPSYLAVKISTTQLQTKIDSIKSNAPQENDVTQNDLNNIKNEISLLKSKGATSTSPSQIMEILFGPKPAGILISRFTYSLSGTGVSAQISGNAETSEDLLQYRRILTADQRVKEARYSTQNYITKKTNIDFILMVDFK